MKTIINLLLGAILLTGLLSSCRKEGSTGQRVWEGRVLEYGSDRPVAGARVYLWEGTSEWWGQSSQYRIDSTESAADGSFRFRYERVGGRYYRITGSADQYYPGEAFLERTSSTKADLVLDPYAWLSLRIKAPDKDVYQIVIETYGCNPQKFLGGEREAVVLCRLNGNRENELRYSLGIYGEPAIHEHKSIYLSALDTTYVEYTY